jgi:hypothetical protein
MSELYKIIPIRESLYHGLKICADTLGLTVDEYAELLLENTHSHKRKSCNCKKKKKYSLPRGISDK